MSMLTKSDLKARGWTESLIDAVLGEPDQLRKNPHHRSGPPMQLFEHDRVVAKETEPEFVAAQAKRASRQQAARKGVNTKRRKLTQKIDKITVPQLELEVLLDAAINHFNERQRAKPRDYPGEQVADRNSDSTFLVRIQVNYLRHRESDYDDVLDGAHGRIGLTGSYARLRLRVLDAIAKQYPHLAEECRRQKAAK
jgi:hypothetical protein